MYLFFPFDFCLYILASQNLQRSHASKKMVGFTFEAVIRVGLIFVYSARLGSLLFACECSFVLASLMEKTSLSPLNCLRFIECLKHFTFNENQLPYVYWFISGLSWFHEFMCLSFQSYHSVLIVVPLLCVWISESINLSTLFQSCFGYSNSFAFPYKCEIEFVD